MLKSSSGCSLLWLLTYSILWLVLRQCCIFFSSKDTKHAKGEGFPPEGDIKSMLNSYNQMGENQQTNDMYMNRTDDELYKFVLDNSSMDIRNITAPKNRRLFYFLCWTSVLQIPFGKVRNKLKKR